MQLDGLLKVLLTKNRACSLQQGQELQEGLNGGPHDKQSPRIQNSLIEDESSQSTGRKALHPTSRGGTALL